MCSTNPPGDLHMETAPSLPLKEIPFNGISPGKMIFIPAADKEFPAGLSFHPVLIQSMAQSCLAPCGSKKRNFKLAKLNQHRAIPRFSFHGLALPALLDQKKEPL